MKSDSILHQSVAFLLGLGALPIACNGDDDDGGVDTGNQPTTSVTNGGSTSDGTSDDAMTSQGSMSTMPGTTGDTNDVTDTGAASDATGTATSGQPNSLCELYGAWYEECLPRYTAEAIAFCEQELEAAARYGSACLSANEDYFACTSAIDCRAIDDVECGREIRAIENACPR
jgi:hypothetical protein